MNHDLESAQHYGHDQASIFPVLGDFENNGRTILQKLICGSPWQSLEQALASLTVFAHPDVLKALESRSVFRTIRGIPKGKVENSVMLDDNATPAHSFEWATKFNRKRGDDVDCCHLYAASNNPTAYTDVRNIFMAPAFLAKLTNSQTKKLPEKHPLHVLRYRAWELYGYCGPSAEVPTKPVGYEKLKWANPIGEGATRETMRAYFISKIARRPKSRMAKAARSSGWTFSDYAPDDSVIYTGS